MITSQTSKDGSDNNDEFQVVEELTESQVGELHQLIQQQWWGRKRSLDEVKTMVCNTGLMIGLVERSSDRLVGYCRALTDFAFRATIYDVMVEESLQGTGLGKRLLDAIFGHPKIQDVNFIYLACEPNLFPFYERWGFKKYDGRAEWMIKVQHTEE